MLLIYKPTRERTSTETVMNVNLSYSLGVTICFFLYVCCCAKKFWKIKHVLLRARTAYLGHIQEVKDKPSQENDKLQL